MKFAILTMLLLLYGTNNLSKFITETAKKIFISLSVGGGIKTLKDIKKILSAGGDKICINSAAIEDGTDD